MKISELNRGVRAVIVDIDLKSLPMNLSHMEFIPGSEVTLINKSGSEGPFYIKVNENYIMIRLCTAKLIEVSIDNG